MAIRPEQRADFSKLVAGFPDVNRGIKPVEVVLRHLQPPVQKEVTIKPYSDTESFLRTERGSQYLGILRLLNGIQEKIVQSAPDQEIAPLVKEVLAQIAQQFDDINDRFALAIAGEDDDIFQGLLAEVLGELDQWDIAEYFVIPPEAPRAPEREVFQPRNDFERLLVEENATNLLRLPKREDFENDDLFKEALKKRYEGIRSVYLSVLLEKVKGSLTLKSLKFPDLGEVKLEISSKASGTEKYDARNILEQIERNLPQEERVIAKELKGALSVDLDVFAIIHKKNSEFNGADKAKSIQGLQEMYNPKNATEFDTYFWNGLSSLPAFAVYDDSQDSWVVDSLAMGDKIFTGFQQILLRGRRENPPQVDSPEPKELVELSQLPKSAKGGYNYSYDGRREVWTPKTVPLTKTNRNAVFPWTTATEDFDTRNDNVEAITREIARDRGGNVNLPDEWAILQALSLADVLLEGPYQDSNNGKPNGIRAVDQLMHMTGYGYKSVGEEGESRDRQYNIGLVGLMRRPMLPFLDFYGYGGMTLTERIIRGNSFSDINWNNLKKNATRDWCQSLQDSLAAATVALEGFKSGDLRSIGTVDVKTNQVSKVNTKLLAEIRKLFRQVDGYQFGRDSTPAAAGFSGPKESNPTGQYIKIVVRDRKTGQTSEVDTRINQFYFLSAQDLLRWIDKGEGEQNNITGSFDPATSQMIIEYSSNQGKAIKPEILIRRQLLYTYLMATSYEGDVIKDLGKEDILLFGMMVSKEIRDLFARRYFSGVFQTFLTRFQHLLPDIMSNFLEVELPNVEGPNLFSLAGFEELLIYMGYQYKIEDLMKAGQGLLTSLTGVSSK